MIKLIRGALNLMDYNGKTAEKDFSKLPKLVKEDPSKILYITKNKDGSHLKFFLKYFFHNYYQSLNIF